MRLSFSKLLTNTNPKTAVFIFGCQRSGTTMLMNLIGQVPKVSLYREGNPKAMNNYRIKDQDTIEQIINKDKNTFIIFKPVNDIQHAEKLLSIYTNTKAIWIYRDYKAVINSAITKWEDAQKKIVLWILNNHEKEKFVSSNGGDNEQFTVYIENMQLDTVNIIKQLASEDMTKEDGAALLWYIRNKIYFELALQDNEKVKLVNYEKLVMNPAEKLKNINEFIGCNFSNEYANQVLTSSVNKKYSLTLNPKIEKLCRDMLNKFDDLCSN